ncbi:hypothetical protein [Cryobacterium sp. N21]|uniref:hypothetical protein n=1 Tax=Cryobacterium sp. N21 TaxID=2048289 RepID=UPI0013048392|nr:hypothetical protein [Cryobacterium sp. N21]
MGIRLPMHRQRIGKRLGAGSLSLSHRRPLAALASQPPTPIVPQCVGGWEVKGGGGTGKEKKKVEEKTEVQKQKKRKLKRKKEGEQEQKTEKK